MAEILEFKVHESHFPDIRSTPIMAKMLKEYGVISMNDKFKWVSWKPALDGYYDFTVEVDVDFYGT